MQAVAETILKALVSHPEALVITRSDEGDRTRILVQVDPSDVGKVIGKQGRTIQAIRTVLKAAAAKRQEQVTLDLVTE